MSPRLAKILLILAALLGTGPVRAQSYEVGQDKYRKGDVGGCIRALTQALPSATDRFQRTKVLKLLGICQYTNGDDKAAAQSFKDALALDPNLTIAPGEALDDDVLTAFAKEKEKVAKKAEPKKEKAPKTAAKSAAPKTPAPKIAAKAPPTSSAPKVVKAADDEAAANADAALAAGGAAAGADVADAPEAAEPAEAPAAKLAPKAAAKPPAKAAKVAKATMLKVVSKVPAQVFLDGILAGSTGTAIEVDPIDLELEVVAEGFEPFRKTVTATKDETVEVPVELQKPKPKVKPKKKIAAAKKKKSQRAKVRGRRPPRDAGPPAELEREFQTEAGGFSGGYGQPAYGAPGYDQPAMDPAAAGYDVRPEWGGARGRALPKSESNLLIVFLPFGAGQFMHKSYLLAGALAAGQVGALHYGVTKMGVADKAEKKYEAYDAQAVAETPAGEPLSAEDQDYLAKQQKYAEDQRIQAYIGLGAFAGLWVVGAFEALITHKQLEREALMPRRRAETPRVPPAVRSSTFVTLLPAGDTLAPAPAIAWRLGF